MDMRTIENKGKQMAVKNYTFEGTSFWNSPYEADKFGNYSISMYLDEKNLKEFEASGIQGKIKKDEQGSYVTFRRPKAKLIKQDIVKFGPPKVVDKDGKDFKEKIGFGSNVSVLVTVYDTMKGKGSRLEKITVWNWVEFIPFANPEVEEVEV